MAYVTKPLGEKSFILTGRSEAAFWADITRAFMRV